MNILGNVRALRALAMRRRGLTFVAIGKEFGVSRDRARQLVDKGLDHEYAMLSGKPWYELDVRTRNALTDCHCPRTPAAIVQYFKTADIKRVPNIGKKSIERLNAWLVRHGGEPIP